ncbi:aspartate carbamoyltransferase, partial [Candidatus Saccharibacteria bacterium]|nr:aspartate carbamoyltransferase [Candidatus Saccharibacteria bacterium]
MNTLNHILSVDQFDRSQLEKFMADAEKMAELVATSGGDNRLDRRVSANLFYEPSTRTSSSFMAAMQRLGGSVIPINDVNYSSVSKGETLEDTIRTLEQYADVIVLRHPEKGAAARAAKVASVPIINAGDGVGEHPTQALLDLYT